MKGFQKFLQEDSLLFVIIIVSILFFLLLIFWNPSLKPNSKNFSYKLPAEEWERQKKMNTLIELYNLEKKQKLSSLF